MKLEGRITGAGATEFDRAWRAIEPLLDSKQLVIDLRGVIHMDSEARRVLAEIHGKTGAQFLADTPMMKYFADEARRKPNKD
jgi:anti-anti-sigma regulatory factor